MIGFKNNPFQLEYILFALKITALSLIAAELANYMICDVTDGESLWREISETAFVTAVVAFPIALYFRSQHGKLQSLAATLQDYANIDALTGLTCRRSFLERVEAELTAGHPLCLMIIDINGFKMVNDLYGHRAGDEVLREIARRLAGEQSATFLPARLGGDEFAIGIFTNCTDSAAGDYAETLSRRLSNEISVTGGQLNLTASIGVALNRTGTGTVNALLDSANFALRECKRAGGGTPVIFSAAHEDRVRYVKSIERELHKRDFVSQLVLNYQPIVDIQSNRLTTIEALVRWNSPVLGLVPPSDFIPIAERLGLINLITDAVFHLSVTDTRRLPIEIGMSINLSAIDLVSPASILKIIAVLQKEPDLARRFCFEITETAFSTDNEQATASIRMLRQLGARVAVDDFGTGYSNFSKLHSADWNVIKLDRSFVFDVNYSREKRAIIQALVTLAKQLNMQTVIEGVESANHLAIVKDLGVDSAQGYFLGRPQPLDQLLSAFNLSGPRAKPTLVA